MEIVDVFGVTGECYFYMVYSDSALVAISLPCLL